MNGLHEALRMKLEKHRLWNLGLPRVGLRGYTAASVSCAARSQAKSPAARLLWREGRQSVGGDRAHSRCQLRAALGLAGALDVIS